MALLEDVAEPVQEKEPESRRDNLFVISIVVAAFALLAAVVGVAFGMRAIDESDDAVAATAGGEAGATVPVSLTEFEISPASVASGGSLHVTNDGSGPHNLAIEGADLVTADLASGGSEHFDVSSLEAGSYTMYCTLPGHRDSGMESTLEVTAAGGAAAAAPAAAADEADHAEMSAEEMDKVMREVTESFPAETEGKGGLPLEPTVLPDGTKQFELTAEVVDWEVEPGKIVEAWTYNGMVPGPTLSVGVGDKIRIVLTNELPESTAIHFHGLRTPNSMDGVPDITQEPVKPGETFTYEWTTRDAAVGMYHSHHNAAEQVPDGLAGTILDR